MKIVKVEDLHCDAGWRVNSFLKITTSEEMSLIGKDGYGAAAASSTRGRRGRTHSPWLPVSWIY